MSVEIEAARLFVTGAAGFIGSHTVSAFCPSGTVSSAWIISILLRLQHEADEVSQGAQASEFQVQVADITRSNPWSVR